MEPCPEMAALPWIDNNRGDVSWLRELAATILSMGISVLSMCFGLPCPGVELCPVMAAVPRINNNEGEILMA